MCVISHAEFRPQLLFSRRIRSRSFIVSCAGLCSRGCNPWTTAFSSLRVAIGFSVYVRWWCLARHYRPITFLWQQQQQTRLTSHGCYAIFGASLQHKGRWICNQTKSIPARSQAMSNTIPLLQSFDIFALPNLEEHRTPVDRSSITEFNGRLDAQNEERKNKILLYTLLGAPHANSGVPTCKDSFGLRCLYSSKPPKTIPLFTYQLLKSKSIFGQTDFGTRSVEYHLAYNVGISEVCRLPVFIAFTKKSPLHHSDVSNIAYKKRVQLRCVWSVP